MERLPVAWLPRPVKGLRKAEKGEPKKGDRSDFAAGSPAQATGFGDF
jgi:hypothetical protein